MEEPEQPAKTRRSGAARRLPLYLVLLLVGGPVAYSLSRRDPQDEVSALAAKVEQRASDRAVFYRHKGASLGLYGSRGYSLTVFVGDTERFAPAQFLIYSHIDGKLQGELLKHKGAAGVSILTGGRLEAYLARSRLDVSAIERAYGVWRQQGSASKR